MQKKGLFISVTEALCLLVVASCSLTNLNAVWKDPHYQGGKLENVLVIGGSTNPGIRRIFEDVFTAGLKTRGTNAIPSYSIFPAEETLDKDTIDSKSRDLGIDSMLIARVVDTKTKREITSARYSNYYRNTYFSDWPNRYSRFYTQGSPSKYGSDDDRYYFNEYEVVNVETNLYDVQTGKLIWSGMLNTYVGGSNKLEITSLVEVIMKNLSKNQLIPNLPRNTNKTIPTRGWF